MGCAGSAEELRKKLEASEDAKQKLEKRALTLEKRAGSAEELRKKLEASLEASEDAKQKLEKRVEELEDAGRLCRHLNWESDTDREAVQSDPDYVKLRDGLRLVLRSASGKWSRGWEYDATKAEWQILPAHSRGSTSSNGKDVHLWLQPYVASDGNVWTGEESYWTVGENRNSSTGYLARCNQSITSPDGTTNGIHLTNWNFQGIGISSWEPYNIPDMLQENALTWDADLGEDVVAQMARVAVLDENVTKTQNRLLKMRERLLKMNEMKAKVGAAVAVRKEAMAGVACEYWFIKAENLKLYKESSLCLTHQELRKAHPDWFVRKRVSLRDALQGTIRGDTLIVSHRWETPDLPDPDGVQLQAIKDFLKEHDRIAFVWYDFWCLPQGKWPGQDKGGVELTSAEQRLFLLSLPNINILYLSGSVLLLVDISYPSRFWTQFEAWLSMQMVTQNGLKGFDSKAARQTRCSITTMHSAPDSFADMVRDMWNAKTPDEVYNALKKPDVTVTNQGDKDVQLEKIQQLSKLVADEAKRI